jgi:hypothetical protein
MAIMDDLAVYVDAQDKVSAWDGGSDHWKEEKLRDEYQNVQFCRYDLEFPSLDSVSEGGEN